VKLELWRPLIDLDKEFDSLFRLRRSLADKEEFPYLPSMDVDRKNGELIVTAEVPGLDPAKDVEIIVQDDFLTITGEKSEDKEISEDDHYVHERTYGRFVRRVPLPEGVNADEISAEYSRGILTITVMLPEETAPVEPRKIPVSAN
jgi:HSP20 family molecular chaperone IbpA